MPTFLFGSLPLSVVTTPQAFANAFMPQAGAVLLWQEYSFIQRRPILMELSEGLLNSANLRALAD
ncbi:MAG: hypothetical protein BCS36_11205 [Desulfovibrio sp. MES5]|nr:MAG: hypothetical protein BCS36_11205 [Desulfovibrio sp. MES5]